MSIARGHVLSCATGTIFAARSGYTREKTMNLEDLLANLERLTPDQYGYLGLAALFGPFVLRLLGFKLLARLVRPLSLVALAGGWYARQQKLNEEGTGQPG